HTGHRAGAVRLGDFRYHANRVGEGFFRGQYCCHTTTGKTTVADFATLGTTHEACFTDTVGREVVVQHEVVFLGATQILDGLCIAHGTKGGDYQRLGFTAGEQRAAVSPLEHTHFDVQATHRLVVAAVDTRMAVDDTGTHDFLLQRGEHTLYGLGVYWR